MKKNLIFFAFCIVFFITSVLCFSQEALEKQGVFFLSASPVIQVNTDGLPTAPTPILFSLGFGYRLSFLKTFSFVPEISYWSQYYLWENDKASPAPIEKRDVFVPQILIDLPLFYSLQKDNHVFNFGLGIGLLNRIPIATSVLPDDESYKVSKIAKFFWGKGNFIYPEFSFFWDYVLENGSSLGLGLKGYYPLANLYTSVSSPFHNSLWMIKIRCFFPKT